jgi:N-acetylglutamate synthase
VRYRMEIRISAADVDSRVVVRWRRPGAAGDDEVADVLGILEAADAEAFLVRKDSGEVVTIPLDRALAGKPVPPKPVRSASRQAPPRR